MDRGQGVDGFEFDDQTAADQQIEAPLPDWMPLV